MKYPTVEQVEKATRIQLARWYRFLPSPGTSSIERSAKEFEREMTAESEVQGSILARFEVLGGMTPGISKAIGWG